MQVTMYIDNVFRVSYSEHTFIASFMPTDRATDSMMTRLNLLKAIHFSWFVSEILVCCLAHRGSTVFFFFFAPVYSK